MKAYLIENDRPLVPYSRPVSSVSYKGFTVRERLIKQLKRAGYKVIAVAKGDDFSIEEKSLVLSDDILLSDNFLGNLLSSIPGKRGNYQVQMDVSRYPMLTPKSKPSLYKTIPVYYFGSNSSWSQAEFEPLAITPKIVFETSDGLPARMNELTDLRLCFTNIFAIHIDQWFDLQTATGLYCSELVSKMATQSSRLMPAPVVKKALSWQRLAEKVNIIGKNCRIHPTAVLEGCIIGDNVEIGPYSYLRSSVVDDGSAIRERTSVKISYIGKRSFIMGSDIVNSYVGEESSVIAPMLYHVVFGERSFISGGSGFADFNTGSTTITASVGDKEVQTGLNYLGSCVGDDCFIGANMIFAPGRAIPDGTKFLDHGLLKNIPKEGDSAYVLSGSNFLQIPKSFFGATDS